MRILLLFVFFIVLHTFSYSQNLYKYWKDSSDLHKVRSLLISLDTAGSYQTSPLLPFSNINVSDVRFDTAQIGLYSYVADGIYRTLFNYRINIDQGVSVGLSNYLNSRLNDKMDNSDNRLICFIKKFTIVGRDTLYQSYSRKKTKAQLYFNADFFYRHGDDFFPAFKIDTVITEQVNLRKKEITDEIHDYLLSPLLASMLHKIATADWQKVKAKNVYNQSVVENNYFTQRFDIPILVAQKIKRGIYKNFNEFKSNKPSIEKFSVKTDRNNITTFREANGNIINPARIFGFSEGNRIWIQKKESSFPLIRTGNSFQFFWSITSEMKVLLYVDMEKGEII